MKLFDKNQLLISTFCSIHFSQSSHPTSKVSSNFFGMLFSSPLQCLPKYRCFNPSFELIRSTGSSTSNFSRKSIAFSSSHSSKKRLKLFLRQGGNERTNFSPVIRFCVVMQRWHDELKNSFGGVPNKSRISFSCCRSEIQKLNRKCAGIEKLTITTGENDATTKKFRHDAP